MFSFSFLYILTSPSLHVPSPVFSIYQLIFLCSYRIFRSPRLSGLSLYLFILIYLSYCMSSAPPGLSFPLLLILLSCSSIKRHSGYFVSTRPPPPILFFYQLLRLARPFLYSSSSCPVLLSAHSSNFFVSTRPPSPILFFYQLLLFGLSFCRLLILLFCSSFNCSSWLICFFLSTLPPPPILFFYCIINIF
jgi:hypothetical protein